MDWVLCIVFRRYQNFRLPKQSKGAHAMKATEIVPASLFRNSGVRVTSENQIVLSRYTEPETDLQRELHLECSDPVARVPCGLLWKRFPAVNSRGKPGDIGLEPLSG
jgi:hypothetical protein